MVVLLCHRLLGFIRPRKDNRWVAAAAGLLFGVHPLHVEPVVWIASRKDVLYACFFLASLLAYACFIATKRRSRWWLYFLSLVAFTLSLMSKPMAVSLPAILLVLDFYPFRRIRSIVALFAIGFVEKLPFYIVSLAISTATMATYSSTQISDNVTRELYGSLVVRTWGAFRAIAYYMQKALLPSTYRPITQCLRASRVPMSPIQQP